MASPKTRRSHVSIENGGAIAALPVGASQDDPVLAHWLTEAAQLRPVAQLTQADIDATYAAAAGVLAYLQEKALPPATLRALRSVLRYWSLWHRAVFGEELGLLNAPREAVPGERVLVFIAHHAPVLDRKTGKVTTGMPADVRERLAQLEAVEGRTLAGNRRVAQRAARSAAGPLLVADDVPALKTVQQRVSLLGTLHDNFNLLAPQVTDGRIRPVMAALRKAVIRTVDAALPQSKRAIEGADLQALLNACHPVGEPATRIGKRDQALLLATFSSGRRRSEVARMRQEHLQVGTVTLSDGQAVVGYWWHLYELKGRKSDRLDAPLLSVPLVGAAAEAMDVWLDVLRGQGETAGPVWRRVYLERSKKVADRQERVGAPLKPDAVAEVVKQRAGEALVARSPELQGSDPETVREREAKVEAYVADLGAHSLRSGFVTSELKAGVHPLDIAQLTGHGSMSSFRIYDQRKTDGNPVLRDLMQFRL